MATSWSCHQRSNWLRCEVSTISPALHHFCCNGCSALRAEGRGKEIALFSMCFHENPGLCGVVRETEVQKKHQMPMSSIRKSAFWCCWACGHCSIRWMKRWAVFQVIKAEAACRSHESVLADQQHWAAWRGWEALQAWRAAAYDADP